MYDINRYGKIIINDKEVYYGCVTEYAERAGIAKLYVIDWRDRFKEPKEFYELTSPTTKFIIKYNAEMEQ